MSLYDSIGTTCERTNLGGFFAHTFARFDESMAASRMLTWVLVLGCVNACGVRPVSRRLRTMEADVSSTHTHRR